MRLLVASYYYPPWALPGANRWAAMTKYLRQLGHEVTVVTTAAPISAQAPPDRSGALDGVVRTADLTSSTALRRILRRPTAAGTSSTLGMAPVASTSALLTKVIVPDAYLASWNPWALRAIGRVLNDRRIECMITTGPPDSTHLLALALGRRRPAWIADFRDGWLFQPLRSPFPTAPQRHLERWLEHRTVTKADAIVGVTRPIVDDFRERFGAPAQLITNGWDPELTPSDVSVRELVDPGRFTFLHTGTISGGWGRDPRPLVTALRHLIEGTPELRHRVQVLFVGVASPADLALLGDPLLDGVVQHAGVVARAEVLALQRAADALLLLTSTNTGEATGKLFEYLGAGRPILALAHGNEAARIVGETGTGVCVSPRDVDAIEGQLRRAIDGELGREYAPRDLDRYSYPGPAVAMAEVAQRAVAARAALASRRA